MNQKVFQHTNSCSLLYRATNYGENDKSSLTLLFTFCNVSITQVESGSETNILTPLIGH